MEQIFSIPPPDLMGDCVCSFWQVQRFKDPVLNETIIPKGVTELIFSFETTPIHARVNDRQLTVPRCFLQGYSTSPIYLHVEAQQTFFGVVLNPAAVNPIFHFYPRIFSNCVVDLTQTDSGIRTLWHLLAEKRNFNERVTAFSTWLNMRLPQLSNREIAFNKFLKSDKDAHLSVEQLANRLCYSSKQLSRRLLELTGMNTEQTLLYKKYLQAVHLIHSSDLSLTEIAYSCNFFDQSHFIRTFKAFSRLTPHEYRQRKSSVVGHIFENVF